MWIVLLALRRPYTFVVAALLLVLLTPLILLRTPTDIFPPINIPVVSVVWQYTGEDSGNPGWSFRSTHISAARRLPNGNTFIDEGQSGRLFQVTRDGDIVWEYVNPYFRVGKDPLTGRVTANNSLYRGQPVPYEWVPAGTPHSEKAVVPPELSQFPKYRPTCFRLSRYRAKGSHSIQADCRAAALPTTRACRPRHSLSSTISPGSG